MNSKGRFIFAVVASTSFAWGALAALEACSSDNGSASSGAVSPVPEAGAKDANPGDTSVTTPDSSMQQDAGSECGAPAALHAPKSADAGIYCPFSAPAGGKNIYCAENQECCENVKGAGVSTCETKGAACPVATATAWECEDPVDCAGSVGKVCCAHSGDGGAVTVGSDTCGAFLSKFSGTRCQTACGAGELVVCEKQSECTTGTCTAVKPKGNDIGVCK